MWACEQVRQKLYKSSIGKWRRYSRQLAPVANHLAPLIQQYEAELGKKGHDEL